MKSYGFLLAHGYKIMKGYVDADTPEEASVKSSIKNGTILLMKMTQTNSRWVMKLLRFGKLINFKKGIKTIWVAWV